MYQIERTPLADLGQITKGCESVEQKELVTGDGTVLEYLTFPILSGLGCVRHLFTTRKGGVSKGIFSSMNLSFTRGDNEADVMENYRRVAKALDMPLSAFVCSDQTHTTNIRIVTKEDAGKGVTRQKDYTDIDGLITNERGLVLSTFYADCIPLYFVDPVKKAIGLSHSGWRGTVEKMGKKTVEKMKEVYGCDSKDIYGVVGPGICKQCYEVSQDVAEAFWQSFGHNSDIPKEILEKKEGGKYRLDLWRANYRIMLEAGILREHIQVTDVCTCHNPDYLFSHRATNGKRGNLAAFLCLE